MSVSVIYKRSDGQSMTFGDGGLFRIPANGMKGFGKLKPELFSKKRAVGDGNIITGKRIPARELELSAELSDARLNASMRKVLTSFFNPEYTFDVYVTYMNEQRYAKGCSLQEFDAPTDNIYKKLKVKIIMLHTEAYFLSVDEFGKNIAATKGGRGFPYVNLVGKTFPFGAFEFSRNVQVNNDGDVRTYCKAVFNFTGEVTNPRIIKGASYVMAKATFRAGDVLTIDASDKSILLNGENVSTIVEKGSRWNDMVFERGDNTIGYDADAGSNLMSVTIYFNKRYLGV